MAKILLVDDDPDVRTIIEKFVVSAGHDVTAVGSGLEALKKLTDDPIDLMITDILMPDMTGIKLIDDVHGRHPEIKILAISGGDPDYSPQTCTALARDRGADGAIMKPILRDTLIAEIDRLLEKPPV